MVSRKNTDLLVSRFCCVNIEEIQNDLFFKSNENTKTESKAWNIPFTKEQLGWTVCISWHISYSWPVRLWFFIQVIFYGLKSSTVEVSKLWTILSRHSFFLNQGFSKLIVGERFLISFYDGEVRNFFDEVHFDKIKR